MFQVYLSSFVSTQCDLNVAIHIHSVYTDTTVFQNKYLVYNAH